jgi:hypothetical protein
MHKSIHYVFIVTTIQLILFGKKITVYSGNHAKHINMHGENVDSFNVKAGGMYSYHCVS